MNHSGKTPKSGLLLGRSWFRFLGSVKLAMILLAVLIVACVVGTVAESRFDTAVAQAYFYGAPWFTAWLLLLCVNLIFAVLVRYPWKRHQTGFIITHAGIVILLIGAWIGRLWGVEGMLTLVKGSPPANTLVLDEMFLEVRTNRTAAPTVGRLTLSVRPPTPDRPLKFKAGDVRIAVREYARELASRTVVKASPAQRPAAVRFVLRSAMVPEPIEQWLVLNDPELSSVNFGPAAIRFVAETEGTTSTAALRERHYVFAKFPEMSIARPLAGEATGARALFRPGRSESEPRSGTLELQVAGRRIELALDQILDRVVSLEGTPWQLQNAKYLPDFRFQNQQPVSASDQPNNPALVFEITRAAGGEAASAPASECTHPKDQCAGDHESCCPKKSEPPGAGAIHTGLTIYYRPDASLRYSSMAQGKPAAEGVLRPGDTIRSGWADWTMRVEEVLPSAVVQQELGPLSAKMPKAIGRSGILVDVQKGAQQWQRWIATGMPVPVTAADEEIVFSVGCRRHELPFAVALERFEVERDEGTHNPAGFKSYVHFIDPAAAALHPQKPREIWMNHPANFPDFWGANWLGTTYKFSQASWNPNNLNQTTLQVLRDPGWSLKWTGSLLICGGLFAMFYLRPQPRLPAATSL